MLTQDFKEFLKLLNQNQVEYLIVGGYAVAMHGYPRYTGDLDIWINANTETAAKIIEVLDEFGFGSLGLRQEDFMESGNVIQMGYPPFRIDILTKADGVDFVECYRNGRNQSSAGVAMAGQIGGGFPPVCWKRMQVG